MDKQNAMGIAFYSVDDRGRLQPEPNRNEEIEEAEFGWEMTCLHQDATHRDKKIGNGLEKGVNCLTITANSSRVR